MIRITIIGLYYRSIIYTYISKLNFYIHFETNHYWNITLFLEHSYMRNVMTYYSYTINKNIFLVNSVFKKGTIIASQRTTFLCIFIQSTVLYFLHLPTSGVYKYFLKIEISQTLSLHFISSLHFEQNTSPNFRR